MPETMPTLGLVRLYDRFVHFCVARVDVSHCGLHVSMARNPVERERVYPLCPTPQHVKLEWNNSDRS
jgi:hypothetical protein